jgi:alpha-galactosidase
MSIKIAIIGAGSATFSLSIIRDLCLTPNLEDATVCFMDIDPARLEAAHELATRYAQKVGSKLRLEKTTDRIAALNGADFILNAALAAGHHRLRDGWQIGLKHGYRMGGSLHIMHDEAFWINFYQLKLFDSLLQDILHICPNAWYLQIANSVLSGTTMLGRKYPQAKMVGLCHGYTGVNSLIRKLGLDPADCHYELPGVNHFLFLTRLYHKGQDAFPLLDRWIAEQAPEYWKTNSMSDDMGPGPVDVYKRFGVFPIGDTSTPGGGSWPWWYHTDDATDAHWREAPLDWYGWYFKHLERNIAEIRRVSEDPAADPVELVGPEKSHESFIPIIESIACDIPRTFIVNIPNAGEFVPGVPQDFAVEIPAMVSKLGIQGIRTNPLPRPILAHILRDRVAPVEMELAAYEAGSKQLLRQLVMMDPWTRSIQQAEAFLDEIFSLPYHEEMRQHYRQTAG